MIGNCTRSRRNIPGQAGNDEEIVWNDGMHPKLPSGERKIKPLPEKRKRSVYYFCLRNTCTGHPRKSKCERSLFSRKRLYGSRMYCGRLQKNANDGERVGS